MCLIVMFDISASKATAAEIGQKCAAAEKEVVKVDSRIQETTLSLSRYQRDSDCKYINTDLLRCSFLSLDGRSFLLRLASIGSCVCPGMDRNL